MNNMKQAKLCEMSNRMLYQKSIRFLEQVRELLSLFISREETMDYTNKDWNVFFHSNFLEND